MAGTQTTSGPRSGDRQPVKSGETKKEDNRQMDVRMSNISAAKSLADCVRTSLGPRGMDKMIVEPDGKGVVVSNDGATILSKLQVTHPCAKMLVELSKAQDTAVGDGTTTVVILCGAFLSAVEELLHQGIHPTHISKSFQVSAKRAEQVLEKMSHPVDVDDRAKLIQAAVTSLYSKVIAPHSDVLAPMAVDVVKSVVNRQTGEVDLLRDIRVVTAVGDSISNSKMILDGMVFKQGAVKTAGGPTSMMNAKIGLIQFCLSPPKTDMESTVTVTDYTQMDRAVKETARYQLNLCKKIQRAGVNVLLIQKSILRDAVTSTSLNFLSRMKIMVIKNVERNDIDFITRALGVMPAANIDSLTEDKLGFAESVREIETAGGKLVELRGVKLPESAQRRPTASVLLRSENKVTLAEVDRSFHDSLCVIKSLANRSALIAGGAAPETEVALRLGHEARESATGYHASCMRSYATAFEMIPFTLAENTGLNAIELVTKLRAAHNKGLFNHGLNVRTLSVTDMMEEEIVQPLLVSLSAVRLATETVVMLLKIDDIVMTR